MSMINSVAKGSFKRSGGLPDALIREINILEDRAGNPRSKDFRFSINIALQYNAGQEYGPFNLLVVAFRDKKYLRSAKIYKRTLKHILKNSPAAGPGRWAADNKAIMKTVPISGLVLEKPRDAIVYNPDTPAVYNKMVEVSFNLGPALASPHVDVLVVPWVQRGRSCVRGSAAAAPEVGFEPIFGQIVVESVLAKGSPPTTTGLLRLSQTLPHFGKEGDVWMGSTHFHPRHGLMAGESHTNSPHPRLVTHSIPNYKIKDFRVKSTIEALGKPLNTHRRDMHLSHFPDIDIKKVEQYFGETQYSRLFDNSVGVLIPFDFGSYVIDNFEFSRFIMNRKSLLSCAAIREIKIYRQRVSRKKEGNRLTPNKNFPDPDCFKISPTLVGTLQTGEVKLLDLPGTSNGIQHIFIRDDHMSSSQQSYFEYSVEVILIDTSREALSKSSQRLLTKLEEYGSYLVALRSGIQKGADYKTFHNANIEGLFANDSWKGLIREFLNSMGFIYGIKNTRYRTVPGWANKLLPFANPYSATYESAFLLKELISGYCSRIMNNYSTVAAQRSDAPFTLRQSIYKSASSYQEYKIVYIPKDRYYNQLNRLTGYDYFGSQITEQGSTFSKIRGQDYVLRVNQESAKYQIPNPAATGVNKYAYMSPRFIRTPTADISVEAQMDLQTSYDLYQANILPQTEEKNFLGDPNLSEFYEAQVNRIINFEGVSFSALPGPITQIASARGDQPPMETLSIGTYLTDNNPFVQVAPQTPLDTDIPAYRERLRRASALLYNSMITSTVEDSMHSYEPFKLGDIENIKGSLAHARILRDPDSVSRMNLFELNINYNSIVRVEYFAGYGDSIRSPRWVPVNTSTVNNIQRRGTAPLLCRLKEIDSVFALPNKFKLSNFNQYFILGDTELPITLWGTSATFVAMQSSIDIAVYSGMKAPMVNPSNRNANIFPQYTYSPSRIGAGTDPAAAGRRARHEKRRGFANGQRSGGRFANGQRRHGGRMRTQRSTTRGGY